MTTTHERFINPRGWLRLPESRAGERRLYATSRRPETGANLANATVTIVIESAEQTITPFVQEIASAAAADYPDHDLHLILTRPRKPTNPF